MEQLINATSLGNVIIVTGSFVLLMVLIRLFAWEQITAIFDARAEKINNDLDSAENARKEAEDLAQKRQEQLANSKEEAGLIIDRAKETADQTAATTLAEARDEVRRMKEKAAQEIEQSKVEALSSVKEEVADVSLALAGKLLAQQLDKGAQHELIDQYIQQLGEA